MLNEDRSLGRKKRFFFFAILWGLDEETKGRGNLLTTTTSARPPHMERVLLHKPKEEEEEQVQIIVNWLGINLMSDHLLMIIDHCRKYKKFLPSMASRLHSFVIVCVISTAFGKRKKGKTGSSVLCESFEIVVPVRSAVLDNCCSLPSFLPPSDPRGPFLLLFRAAWSRLNGLKS